VSSKGQFDEPIKHIRVSDTEWASRHWRTLQANYARAAHFRTYAPLLEDLYLGCNELRLSAINRRFLSAVCEILGIRTKVSWSWEYQVTEGPTERIVSICRQAGADVYVSGPSAASYLDRERFHDANVDLLYFDYTGYPEYRQLFPPFEHRVSVLDLILNEGPEAPRYMLSL
jgi:hypothetical protein